MCDNCAEARRHAEQISNEMNTGERVREFYRRQGECREQERIIKLLEEHLEGYVFGALSLNKRSNEIAMTTFDCDIIALIKGENK